MSAPGEATSLETLKKPRGDLAGFVTHARRDFLSGLLVFLIALPLCLGIALASGFPAIAGVFTAICGAILCPLVSNSELTIKGPAAGLIVIVLGAIEAFGGDGVVGGFSAEDYNAYRMVLAIAVGAGVLQLVFGFFKGGILGEFFPLSVVHGMLAAIGLIIIVKQVPVALGVQASGEVLEMMREIPDYFRTMNPYIAMIGIASLAIMFLWPWLQQRLTLLKAVPAALVVILVAVPMGNYFDLLRSHPYDFNGQTYKLGEEYLVKMPDRPFGMLDAITFPDFSVYWSGNTVEAFKWMLLLFVIGTLESVLSAKAVDIIDPWRRKTDLDRDVIAIGGANVLTSLIGGLPMISEIVRSKANIDNGGRTRFANLWHGIFLLACVALIPTWLHRIPLAALAAMLIYTGFRLTHPKEFLHVYRIGPEQLMTFIVTLIGVLATDLLVGVAIGIGFKMGIHLFNGVPIYSLFKPSLDVQLVGDDQAVVRARYSAVFSNWILFRRHLVRIGLVDGRHVTLDLSKTRLVDHSVMEKLHQLGREFDEAGLSLTLMGLESHRQLSSHQLAARVRESHLLQRITVIGREGIEQPLRRKLAELGATGYTVAACHGVGRTDLAQPSGECRPCCRLETVTSDQVAERILEYLRHQEDFQHDVTVYVERVDPLRHEQFV